MAYRNYINLKESELDRAIYRIMPVRRLLQCFEESSLALVPPRKWDDPFENLLLSAKIKIGNGESASIEARNSVYGQCWTQHRETDAMWRIYSGDKHGAKVKTTPRRLLESLISSNPEFSELHCFIGKVSYLTQKDLVSYLPSLNLFDDNGSGIAESLLYKRKEFSHEKELRLIYTDGEGPVHKFRVDPLRLFDEIVFDPRMDNYLVRTYKASLERYGFENRIEKSVLYQPPKDLVIRLSG